MNGARSCRSGRSRVLMAMFFSLVISLAPGASVGADDGATTVKPPILSASEIHYPPFSLVDAAGRADGFSVEMLRAAAGAMGREVTFRTGPWAEVRSRLEKGEVQALPLVGRTPERESLFDFSVPYMSLHGAIVVRESTTDIQYLHDLSGKQVAVMQGDNTEEFLRREDRGIEIRTTATFEQALDELAKGRHDAVVIQRLVGLRLIQELGLTNLRVVNEPVEGFRQDFCFAVKEGDRETLALLNEGLALVMADGTYRHLHAKWFAAMELPSDRRIVIGGDYDYPPYEYLDENGRPAGYNVDLTRAIAREVGLDIEIRLGPWPEIIRGLESGEIDAVQGMFYSAGRDLKFDFTPPHTVNNCVSVVRQGEGVPPSTLGELAGKRLVVQRGDIMHDFVVEHGLGARVSVVESQEIALQELAKGRYDCALVARMTALYWIRKQGWANLTVGGRPFLSPGYCYAAPPNQKALLAQLGEGLKVLDETGEYRRIQEKWMGVYEEAPPRLATILRYIAMVAIPLSLLLLAVFLWSWSLRKQVARRTDELRRSEAQFRSLVEGAPDAIFVQTNDRLAYLNPSMCKLYGARSADQLLGQPVVERLHSSIREIDLERMRLLIEKQERIPLYEAVHLRLDGSEVPVEVSAVPIVFEGERGALVFVRDITQRKQSERALRQRQAMLSRTEEIAHIGSWEWDVTRDQATWSDELFRIFQLDPAGGALSYVEVKRHHLFHPEDFVRLRRAVETTISEGTPYELELRVLRPDGTVRHCLARGGNQERGADGKTTSLYGSIQDITEFKLTQDRIEHLNKVLRAIRDVNQLIVRERDRDTLIREGCRLLVENRGYSCALIVLTDENDRPVSWAEAGMEANFEPMNAMLERGELYSCFEQVRLTGATVQIQERDCICANCPIAGKCAETATPLRARLVHGDIAFGYLAVGVERGLSVDLEEQSLFSEMAGDLAFALRALQVDLARTESESRSKSLEVQLLQAQKMESVGRLAGGVAHDYNNMLGVIIGYAELALDKVAPGRPLYLDLQEILNAARRSAEITRQLLAFARKQTINPRVVDLNETVDGMLKMLRRLIGEDIELAWLPETGLWPVKMDPAQLDQILANLCVNARDAIAGVGKITIETHNLNLDQAYCADHAGFYPGRFVQLTFSDDGCGMDHETLVQIFEPFFTTKDLGHGTGLGLATVYGIVKQNNGFINVYSEPGKGTTFKIYLPGEADEVKGTTAESEEENPESHGETVLLVEDEPSILKMGKIMLEELGYQVLAAGAPSEAMRLAEVHAGGIDLLITDVVMPEMNGRGLSDRLHTLYPELKTLFMSGYTADVIAHRGVLEEGVSFMQKPFSMKDLASKVRATLDQK